MKTIDKIIVSGTAPQETDVLWNKGKKLYRLIGNQWTEIGAGGGGGGTGITVFASEEELIAANQPLGSLAAVAVEGTIKESSFRDLYQPDASILDQSGMELTTPELLSSVSSIEVTAPEGNIEGVSAGFYLVPRTFSATNQQMVMIHIGVEDGVVIAVDAMATTPAGQTQYKLVSYLYADGVPTIDQTSVDALNALLATDDWCYFSNPDINFVISEEQFATLDNFVTAVAGVPSVVDIYVKKDSWEKMLANELTSIDNNIKSIESSKQDVVKFGYSGSYGYRTLYPNIKYSGTCVSSSSLKITLAEFMKLDEYHEYYLEIQLSSIPQNVVFFDEEDNDVTDNIVWIDGESPEFIDDYVYIITLCRRAHGYGYFARFEKYPE